MIFMVNWFLAKNAEKKYGIISILCVVALMDIVSIFYITFALEFFTSGNFVGIAMAYIGMIIRTAAVIYLGKWFCLARPDDAKLIKRVTAFLVLIDIALMVLFGATIVGIFTGGC